MMLTITLKNATFNVPVGLFPQELKTYNTIEIDIAVSIVDATHLDMPFINYGDLFEIAKLSTQQNFLKLEEMVTYNIETIKNQYPTALIEVAVRKQHPPLGGVIAYAEVRFKYEGA